jgi:hypothetical protein
MGPSTFVDEWVPPEGDTPVEAGWQPPEGDAPVAAAWQPPKEDTPVAPTREDDSDQVSRQRGKAINSPVTPLYKDLWNRNDAVRIADVMAEREKIRQELMPQVKADIKAGKVEFGARELEQRVDAEYKRRRPNPNKDMSFGQVAQAAYDAAVENPGEFAVEFLKETVANLQYLLPMFSEFGLAKMPLVAARAGKTLGKTTTGAVRAADAGAMGAIIGTPGSMARQMQEHGEVTSSTTLNDALMAAGTTAIAQPVLAGVTAAIGLGAKRVAKTKGVTATPENVQGGIQEVVKTVDEGGAPGEAVTRVLKAMGLDEELSARMGDEVEAMVVKEPTPIAKEVTPEMKATADAMVEAGETPVAVVRFGGKDFEASNHFIGIKQAMDEGLVPKDPEGRVKKGPDDSMDLFKLKDGTLITRDQAGELFGAKRTEDMPAGRTPDVPEGADLAIGKHGPQQPKPNARAGAVFGEAGIKRMLLDAVKAGEIAPKAVALAGWLMNRNPKVVTGVGMKMLPPQGGMAGFYDSVARVVGIMRNPNLSPDVVVHEILHHTERFMPPRLQRQIARKWERDWVKERARAVAAGETPTVDYMDAARSGFMGDNAARKFASHLLTSGKVPIDTHYQFFNPTEFWAMNGAAMVEARAGMPKGFGAEAKRWMGDFTEKLKHAAGMDSNAPIIRGVENALSTKGVYRSPDMIRQAARHMLENPLPPLYQRVLGKPAALVATGAVAGGVVSAFREGEWEDRLAAAAIAGGATAVALIGRQALGKLASVMKDTRFRAAQVFDTYQGQVARGELGVMRFAKSIKAMVPDAKQREALTHYLQGDASIVLTPEMQQAAKLVQDFFAITGEVAAKRGILPETLKDNYATQLWTGMKSTDPLWANLVKVLGGKNLSSSAGMSPRSRFAMKRVIPSYAEGIGMGLIPKTLDIAEIAQVYGNNITRAIANKNLIQTLQKVRNPGSGKPLVVLHKPQPIVAKDMQQTARAHQKGNGIFHDDMGKAEMQDLLNYRAPAGYVNISHPQLEGMRVDPDIAPQMKALFDAGSNNAVINAANALSVAAKRGIFSYSLFHVKSLLDAGLGTSPKGWVNLVSGRATEQLRGGPTGSLDVLSDLVAGGLKIVERPIEGDVTPFSDTLKLFETRHPVLGMPAKGARVVMQAMDKLLWEQVHPTFKVAAAMAQFEKQLAKGVDRAQAAKNASQFTNDIFGGQDWFRNANDIDNRFGREMALAATSPTGRKLMQILLLAPDWTVSTARSFLGALPGMGNAETRAMHRGYVVRAGLLYLTVADTLNVAFSGHHFWENEDPTMVDLGDGRKLQLSKHFMEPIHWLTQTGQQALNKLGYVVSEPLKQAMGVEYLSPKGAPPMDTSAAGRVKHALKGVAPITGQVAATKGLGTAALGFIGVPIYGSTEEQAVADARERAEKAGKDADKAEKRVRAARERTRKRAEEKRSQP